MRHLSAIARLLVLAAVVVATPAARAGEVVGGLLTITFDDSSKTQYQYGLPIAKEFGIVGTLFALTANANKAESDPEAWGMNWEQIAEFRDAGWEIGSHSVSHPHLTELPAEEVIRELEVSRSEIEAHLGVQPVSFASPFGDYNAETLELIMQRYTYHVLAYGGTKGRNPISAVDPRAIGRMNVKYDMPAQAVCNEMRLAAQTDTWLVLMLHGFVAADPEEYQVSADLFREIAACAAEVRDEGLLRIVTVRQGMELVDGG